MSSIIYLANPNGDEPEQDDVGDLVPDVTINVESDALARWFDPRTGLWQGPVDLAAGLYTLVAPAGGDWVLLVSNSHSV